jgi:hypothetical protein
MTATLTTFRDRLEVALMDASNEIWSTTVLDESIRQALAEYSKINPRRVIGTVTLASSGREMSLSSLSGLIQVARVWLPYTASSPEHPPNTRRFEHWFEEQKLYFPDDAEPQSGEVARIFYLAQQTLNGLDSASNTTFPDDDETLLLTGGAGYAATSRAVDLIEQVTRDRLTAQQLRAWGLGKLQEFRSGLKTVQRQAALRSSSFVPAAKLDRWDKRQGGWS